MAEIFIRSSPHGESEAPVLSENISTRLNNNPGFYNFLLRSCSSVAARSLTLSGVPMFGIHPYLLQAQTYLWNAGIRSWTFNYFLNQQY
jgi:hypothetical protein